MTGEAAAETTLGDTKHNNKLPDHAVGGEGGSQANLE